MRKKALLLLAVVLCAGLAIIGACDNDTRSGHSRINKTGQIRFAMTGMYPPFSFHKDGVLVGFDVDMAYEIARRMKLEPVIVLTPWQELINGLKQNRYEAILSSMAITKPREKLVDFSVPYQYSGAQVMVREDSPFEKVSDLKGKILGATKETTYINDIRNLSPLNIRTFPNDVEALTALHQGELDAVVTDRVVGVYVMFDPQCAIKPLGTPLRQEEIALAFRKEDKKLRKQVNKILGQILNDGTWQQLMRKIPGRDY